MRRRAIMIALLLLGATSGEAQQKDAAVKRARKYESLIIASAIKYRVDPHLIWTVAYLETRFQPREESPAGALGLMQLMPATAQKYGVRNVFDPAQSIDAAAHYLHDLQAMFGNQLDLILAAYNAGEGAVHAWRSGRALKLPSGKVVNPRRIRSRIPPYRETARYVKNGLAVFRMLSRANYFSAPQLARLQDVEPEELRKGSVYAGVGISNEHLNSPNLPKNSTSQSVYSRQSTTPPER